MSPAQQSARERMLDGLRRRNPEIIAVMAKRSRSVSVFKALLPAAAVLLLIALAIAPGLRSGPGSGRVIYKVQNSPAQAAASHIEGAQYRGMDQHGQPFTITASAANDLGSDNIALKQPEGDLTMASGAWLMLKSDTGLFNQSLQTLDLKDNVTLYRNDGTTMNAPDVKINLKQGSATSLDPVQAAGPFGTLNAQGGFDLTGRGADIVFKGPVVLVLDQAPAPAVQ